MTPVDEIKNRLDVVDVIQGYIRLKKAGKDYKALCPFHKERNPSFYVSPSKQIWHCFSCSKGGDAFSFVQEIEGVEFVDALRILAKKAGVILKKQDPKIQSKRNILFEICEESGKFFEEKLKQNKKVHEYLKKRGIQGKTAKDFRIGWAPDSWNTLYNHLTELGYKSKDIESAGLIIQNSKFKIQNSRRHYDRFRNRIMFPLFDLNSQIIGFTGRIFSKEEGTGKYVNTPETLIYNKSQVVYGLDKGKIDIRKKNQCILVEGQFDVIMAHQIGSKNTVAISGTALTQDHLRILKRYTENLVFCFDADIGGEAATKKSIGLSQQFDFNIKVGLLPQDKDPADIIKQSIKKWQEILKKIKPVMDFYFESTLAKYSKKLTVDHKREIAKELLVPIKNISNTVEQAHWLQVLASKLKVEEKALAEAMRRIRAREAGEEIFSMPEKAKASRIKDLEEHVLGLALKHSKHLNYLFKNLKESLITTPEIKKLFNSLKSKKKLLPEQNHLKKYLTFKAEHYDLEEKDVLDEIRGCIKELKIDKLKKDMNKVSLDIKEAEKSQLTAGPPKAEKITKLTKRFSKLANQLNELDE